MSLKKAITLSFLVHIVFFSVITFRSFSPVQEKESLRVFKLIHVLEDTSVKEKVKITSSLEKKELEKPVKNVEQGKVESQVKKMEKKGEDKSPVEKQTVKAVVKTESTKAAEKALKKPEKTKPVPVKDKTDSFEALAMRQAKRLKSVIDMDAKIPSHQLTRKMSGGDKAVKRTSKIREFAPVAKNPTKNAPMISEERWSVSTNKEILSFDEIFLEEKSEEKSDEPEKKKELRKLEKQEKTIRKSASVNYKPLELENKAEKVQFQISSLKRGMEDTGKKHIDDLDPLFTDFLNDDKTTIIHEVVKKYEGVELSLLEEGSSHTAPRLIRYVAPVYPQIAQERGIAGRVVLKLQVMETGEIEDVIVINENVGSELTRNARMSALHCRLAPVYFDGKPVKAEIQMTIRFTLSSS